MRALKVLLAITGVAMLSCTEEASQIGSDFFDGGPLNMSKVDTITIQTSTVMFDSIVTSDLTRLLVGSHEDEDLGILSSGSFFQVGVASAFSIEKEYTSFTRAEMRLVHDGYSYYDTLTPITFRIHKLNKPMELPVGAPYLYNTSTFEYDPDPMGSITYKARPNTKDTVRVLLSESFGRDIIRLAQASSAQVSTSGNFIDYFHGFAIVPSGVDGPMVGFATAVEVRVYYMDKSQTPGVERYLKMESQSNFRFNKIGCDRSGTDLAGLASQRHAFDSDITGGKSYIQSGAGLGLRVSIPHLRSILIDNPALNVVNAVLEIAPAKENYDRNVVLPEKLVMISVDYRNLQIEAFAGEAVLVEDLYLGRDTHYEVDVTAFINQQLEKEEFNDNALVFTTDDETFRFSVDRLYVGDQLNARPMKLTLTFLTYSE